MFIPSPPSYTTDQTLQLTSTLIVCDLLVIVTYVYRVMLSSSNESLSSEQDDCSGDDDFTTRLPSSLTTVDVNTLVTTTRTTDSTFLMGSILSSLYRSSAE